MHVSLEACDAMGDDALAFAIGKRLAALRPELLARAVFPSVTELMALLQTAAQLARNEAPGNEAHAFERALHATMTREERHALRGALKAAHAQSAPFDVARWSQLTDVSGARVGLLLAGTLEAARRVIANEPTAPGDLPPREKLGELLVFAVSDEYADLRVAIGIAVQ